MSTFARISAAALGLAAAAGLVVTGTHVAQSSPTHVTGPLVIGHRGASGYRPEHTISGYRLAVALGADYIEPDLVETKDGVLVDRHEPEIGGTTDVASHPEFADRQKTKNLDGTDVTGWFTEDFTLAELKTLKAVERLPQIRQHNTIYNGIDTVPTMQEVADLARQLSVQYHRTIGLIPEIKHSTYFHAAGFNPEDSLVSVLKANHLNEAKSAVVIQSFEVANLKYLHTKTPVQLVQLTSASGRPYDFTAAGDSRTYADITSPAGLAEVATYAQLIGPDKKQIVPWTADGHLGTPTSLVKDAHAAHLGVTPYTFRNENNFLPADYRSDTVVSDYGNAIAEDKLYLKLGVDGFFTDNVDTGVEARRQWQAEGSPRDA